MRNDVPTINITHDGSTSNYDALEAVGSLMLKNYHERTPRETRDIECLSGRVLRVTELAKPDDDAITSCSFKVETL